MNKTLVTSFFALLLASAALSSCEKCGNVTITNPTPEDSEWLVYKKNDSISFLKANDTIWYKRTGVYAQTLPGAGFTSDDECIDALNVQVRTVMEDVKEKQPQLITRILSLPPDSLVVDLGVGEMGFWELDELGPKADSLSIKGKMYYDVYQVNPKVTKTNTVKKILFNQDYGFLTVEFSDSTSLVRVQPK